MALAVILVVGAGLMIRTFAGCAPRKLVWIRTTSSPCNIAERRPLRQHGQAANMTRQVEDRIEALPECWQPQPPLRYQRKVVSTCLYHRRRPAPKGDLYNGDHQWRFIGPHYSALCEFPF